MSTKPPYSTSVLLEAAQELLREYAKNAVRSLLGSAQELRKTPATHPVTDYQSFAAAYDALVSALRDHEGGEYLDEIELLYAELLKQAEARRAAADAERAEQSERVKQVAAQLPYRAPPPLIPGLPDPQRWGRHLVTWDHNSAGPLTPIKWSKP